MMHSTQNPSNSSARTVVVAGVAAAFLVNVVETTESYVSENGTFFAPEFINRSKVNKKVVVDNNVATKLPWLKAFYETSENVDSAKELVPLISGIKDLFAERNYLLVNDILLEMDLKKLSPTAMVGFVSATYPARNKLNAWSVTVAKVKRALDSLGLDSESILYGLI